MSRGKRIPKSTVAAIVADYVAGLSNAEIAYRYGLPTLFQVRQIARRAGAPMRQRHPSKLSTMTPIAPDQPKRPARDKLLDALRAAHGEPRRAG